MSEEGGEVVHHNEDDGVIRGPNGEVLDETKSVKVGLDREELMAEFALLAEEEREEEERAQAVFIEAVENLKLYSQLDIETISNLLTVLEDSGRDEGAAWEYFFQQGAHQVLLVLLNESEVVEDQRRADQILQMWERIARFVFKLSAEDQGIVYDELRRQGMVETLALAMRHHPDHPPILRRAAFLLAQLFAHDKHTDAADDDNENPSARRRMLAADGLVARFRAMEGQPSNYSPDLLVKVQEMRAAVEAEQSGGNSSAVAAKEEEPKEHHRQQELKKQKQEEHEEEEEAAAKRAEEAERSRKQEADRHPAPAAAAAAAASTKGGRARPPIHDHADLSQPSSEKAPLLSPQQRHAGFNQVVSGDGCCTACVLM